MKRIIHIAIHCLGVLLMHQVSHAQVTLLNDYSNNTSATIGLFQNIHFREGGFSSMYPIPETNGKEFWTVSDRGVNVDGANANPAGCHPTYDKVYGFPAYAPKIHRIRINGDSIQILKTITIKRPNGNQATGLLNPTGYGSTAVEEASTDTVQDCSRFAGKLAAKDNWGIDSEGIVVDKEGNFWICEEGGPTIWKLSPEGIALKRFTPYANLAGAQPQDALIDTVFKYRKNNRGFEGISITPHGKIYAIIQSPILFPTLSTGENTQIHRILEINPADNKTRMFAYLNEGLVGTGTDQIRLRDWKIGDMAAINDHEFLLIEAGARGASDVKKIFKIDISLATPVTAGLYSGKTLEALKDSIGLDSNKIVPVRKKLFLDLLANGWTSSLEKSEGLAIVNDSIIAVGNDNDYGQTCPAADGVAIATNTKSHVFTFGLKGSNKLMNYVVPPSFEPEITLTGNDVVIQDGDSLPSSKDNTHFGNVHVGSNSVKAYILKNAGLVSLSVNDIKFTGPEAAEFSLVSPSAFPKTILAGETFPFQVAFQPLQGGTRNAYLIISSNDTDEGMYEVMLEGEATFSTGIESASSTTRIRVYPNPSRQLAIIEKEFENQDMIQLRIVDIQGNEMISPVKRLMNKGLQRFEINTELWSDGVYFIEVVGEKWIDKQKLVVMH